MAHPFQVGLELPHLQKQMTQEIINAWAAVSDDHNPLHTDVAFASATRFGGTIAHGHIALSYLGQMMQGWIGNRWMHGGKLQDMKLTAPVRPGQSYAMGGTVTEVTGDAVTVAVWMRELPAGPECVQGTAIFPLGE